MNVKAQYSQIIAVVLSGRSVLVRDSHDGAVAGKDETEIAQLFGFVRHPWSETLLHAFSIPL